MISVTLPSLYPDVLGTCLDNLRWTARGKLEIVVVSPFPISGPSVLWIEEHEPRGIAAAHHLAAQHATGDYLFPWADDHLMMDGWDEAAVAEHDDGCKRWPIFSLGLRLITPHNMVELIFDKYTPCWPLMLRRDVMEVGGWLNEGFRAGFSDADLALRVWNAGGRCKWSTVRPVRPTQANVRTGKWGPGELAATLRRDFDLLCSRHERFARSWPLDDMSLCNVSVDPDAF